MAPHYGSAGQGPAQKPLKWINSQKELREHFRAHVDRVRVLGRELVSRHPELIPTEHLPLLTKYLEWHDRAKLDESKKFKALHWSKEEAAQLGITSLISAIHDELLGIDVRSMPDGPEKVRKNAIIKFLNDIDHRVRLAFFSEHGIAPESPLARAFILTERIADVVDRNLDPAAQEELGLIQYVPLTVFIRNPDELEMAKDLAKDYNPLIRDHSLQVVRVRRHERRVPKNTRNSCLAALVEARESPVNSPRF